MAELVYAFDLKSNGNSIRVQVPSRLPLTTNSVWLWEISYSRSFLMCLWKSLWIIICSKVDIVCYNGIATYKFTN